MPESSTRPRRTSRGVSFRRLARLRLRTGNPDAAVHLELWRGRSKNGACRSLSAPASDMARVAERTLRNERFRRPGVLSVVFVDRLTLKEINREFRGVSRETDVISFSYITTVSSSKFQVSSSKNKESGQLETWNLKLGTDVPLADIYISLDNALENARRFHETPRREVLRLVAHGILHALGYRDDTPSHRRRMWSRQERALDQTE